MSGTSPTTPTEDIPECPDCGKPQPLCICDNLAPVENRIEVLILQHPQEQDRLLGTARLTALQLTNATLKIGLSWSSLSKALGREVDPASWAILYLGSAKVAELETDREVVAIDRKGGLEHAQNAILNGIEGVVVLDGTWSQAKALWWRNPWMLKCQRVILGPKSLSLYGKLRREPRSDGLSTIEAVALLLARLEKRSEIADALLGAFERMLVKYREGVKAHPELLPKPKPKRDWRRGRKPIRRR
ncbi:MAG: DTW domain-containing protein [Bradyrhizobiaceae bacterium]|nr:MAG: DTW domain-containing protein [Bradyrhizobiaceae bacterium]